MFLFFEIKEYFGLLIGRHVSVAVVVAFSRVAVCYRDAGKMPSAQTTVTLFAKYFISHFCAFTLFSLSLKPPEACIISHLQI